MKDNEAENEYDLMVARAEFDTDSVKNELAKARESNDYWKEKLAAKLYEFCVAEERSTRLYVEAKLYYPELADFMDKRWTHFQAIAQEMREKIKQAQEHGQ